ncbi:unnamed protein product [Phytophthora fragariaefolia]|uniref:Unnamed protein product n=1 Tax=Phytophthora fragariaefolia TaxID=1490495 RepID=A0A9W6U4M5_9STRA|nr:unnamed protein product [Phytophthora fragariaefolia]
MWLTGDRVPRRPGYVSVGSRRYAEWQNLVYQATTDENDVTPEQEEVQGPAWHDQRCAEGRASNPDGLGDFSSEHKHIHEHIPVNDAPSTPSILGIESPILGMKKCGNAKPVAQRVRKVAPQFREQLFQLIKGLLSAKIIQHSTSPWASPIVVIIKKNGIDIRLCIDYHLVNNLTRPMVYPMPLINDLLDDLDEVLWAKAWDMLCEYVDKLLDACDEWNLSISVAKSFWGLKKVDYLGHRISAGGMEARPKDLSSLADLPFPATLMSMQSFLGSLNYYSRFIEDFPIYASILYELRGMDYFEASGQAKTRLESDDQGQRDKWTRATKAFVVLKNKIVNASILTHFDPDKRPVVILYANKWAISAALVQEHEGVYNPGASTSRTLKPNEINYAWMLNSSGLQGRLEWWAALLSNWTLEIVKCTKWEDEILGVIAASINPRENVDSILTSMAPRKQPRQVISMPPPTVESDEELLVVSFDGSARVKRGGGAFSVIVWNLPDWTVISGASEYKANLTVNEAEYHGLLLGFDLLAKQHVDRNRLIICGDSNLVIRQMRGEMECKAPSLKLLWQKAKESFDLGLITMLQEPLVQRMRMERIGRSQDEEKWIVDLKKYLTGDVRELTKTEAKSCAKIAEDYEIDDVGLLFYCPPLKPSCEDRDLVTRLVIPETLQEDVLRQYHTSLEGGHQGIRRTYQRIRAHFHWRGLYRSVQQYVGQCVDCWTGKGRPTMEGESPGNLQAAYPLQTIAMDHIPSLPKSYKGNAELLIWIDLFTGYVVAKASASRTAQTIAENYEECVFRRFGASEVIRHDREPGFIADFFRSFNKIVGQKQRATMAYGPQANGTAERMVQTLTRPVKMDVSDINQRDWDEYAERLTFALNTAQDRVGGDTPFYLMHGWDPRTTLEAMIPLGSTRRQDREPRRWRYHVQRHYQQARETVNERLRDPIQSRAHRRNESIHPYEIEVDSWDTSLAEGEYEVECITDMRSGRRTRYARTMREFLVHWKGYQEPTWVDEADLNCGALLQDYLRRQATPVQCRAVA